MPDRPNILFIMTDDHAAHALGCYGSRINRTSNLDRIAAEGARFDRCFCTNNICEPSRAAILTGTYNHVNRVTTIGAHLDNRLPNVAKELNAAGYQTAMFGKWHLGDAEPHWPRGFDEWKVLQGQGPYFDPQMNCNGEMRAFGGYTTDVITDLTLDYLARRDKNRPFFVKYHHKAPHRPWDSDEAHAGLYVDEHIAQPYTFDDDYSNRSNAAREARMRIADHMTYRDLKLVPPSGIQPWNPIPNPEDVAGFTLTPEESGVPVSFKDSADLKDFKYQRYIKDYLRCVASVDDNVSRVLEYLDADGIARDTVVIYTSDQGFFLGDHGWYDKRFMYEESLRMPFLVRYPAAIEPGTVVDEIVTNVDFAPSFCDWAGLAKPDYMQGRSFRPLLRGDIPADWPQSMYYRYWMHLAHHYVSAHYGVRTKAHKLIYYYGEALDQPETIDESKPKEWELFDLLADPYELNSVYGRTEYANVQASLTAELARLQALVGDEPFVD